MGTKILIAEDEERIRSIVRDYLEATGYTILEAADGEEALELFYKNKDIALVMLDIMMPKMDGYAVCKEIRESSQVPVLMLTALDQERDELKGFQCGADEYIAKPFSLKILLARIQVLLRRNETEKSKVLTAHGLELDPEAHLVKAGGEIVDLSVREFELLRYFMENPGIALSRDRILSSVWEYDYFGDDRTVDTHVKKLRSKLKEQGNHITTVWGVGYKFEA